MTVKRIQYHQYGGPEIMRLEDFEPAPLAADEILVRVHAAGANPMDFGIRAGRMKMVTGRSFPRAMGYDFAGVVEAVGDRVTRLHVGDEVLGGTTMKSAGAFADVVVTKEKLVVKRPLAGRAGCEIPLHTVGDPVLLAVALGEAEPPGPWLAGLQAQLTHHRPHQLGPGRHAPGREVRVDPPVPVRPVRPVRLVE